jgi:hypothetical protein
VPIDHDDGSNGYVDTKNVLLFGGSKTLMGYNKHTIDNAMVYVDYLPSLHSTALARVGWSATSPESKPPMCSGFIVPTPDNTTHAEVWMNNTCISSDSAHFFRFYNCNASDPTNGGIPVPLANNKFYSVNATYDLHCDSVSWNLTEAQERGLDLGSSLHHLPTTNELSDMMRTLLSF